jgi:hypothetical protein
MNWRCQQEVGRDVSQMSLPWARVVIMLRRYTMYVQARYTGVYKAEIQHKKQDYSAGKKTHTQWEHHYVQVMDILLMSTTIFNYMNG